MNALLTSARRFGCMVILGAICVMAVPNYFEENVLLSSVKEMLISPHSPQSNHLSPDMVEQLIRWSVLDPTRAGIVVFCALFCVAKATSTGNALRLIFDGRPLNRLCKKSPPVNIPCIVDIVRMRTAAAFIVGDLRHFFHQLRLPEQARKFLGVRIGNQYFRYMRLPMGLCWSPFLAQCTSILLMVHREKGQEQLFDESWRDQERLPSSITVLRNGEIVGRAFCVYDNFAIVLQVEDRKFAIKVAKRLLSNAKTFGITFKDLSVHTKDAMMVFAEQVDETREVLVRGKNSQERGSTTRVVPPSMRHWSPYQYVTLLGIEIDLSGEELRWRHPSKRIRKLESLRIQGELTRKEIAAVVGSAIWDSLISLRRLGDIAPLIAMLRTTAKEVKKRSDWRLVASTQPSEKWRIAAELWRADAMLQTWKSCMPLVHIEKTVWLCSDASDDTLAGVELHVDSPKIVDDWAEQDNELEDVHIFIKEVRAAIRTIRRAVLTHKAAALDIVVLMDSIPARRALERGYSTNDVASRMISRLYKFADRRNVALRFVDSDTKFNVADCLTREWSVRKPRYSKEQHSYVEFHEHHNFHRKHEFCKERIDASWRILAGLQSGRNSVPVCGPWLPPSPFDVGADEGDADSPSEDAAEDFDMLSLEENWDYSDDESER